MRILQTTLLLIAVGCGESTTVDEAKSRGKTAEDYPTATADVFREMDGGIQLTPEEIKGRNTWLLWAGGNEAFWDLLARRGYGIVDLLKTLDSRLRNQRFEKKGLINEPGFRAATKPDGYGLWLDEPVVDPPSEINPEIYGQSSGVVGLRLFPNPAFDKNAEDHWDGERYYSDPDYYQDPDLIRPYRVGLTCAICHVAPHPLFPPEDPNSPGWENLSSIIGNQYWRSRGVFGNTLDDSDLIYHVLGSAPPGTVDTSIVATDNVNNPNIVNVIFNVDDRLSVARPNKASGGALLLEPKTEVRPVPHVLVDGADSVGIAAALNRVFVNIGTFSEHWIECHNPLLGVRTQKPFDVALAQKNSVFWQVTERRVENLAKFLTRVSRPEMRLADAPGGNKFLTENSPVIERGKLVFAENCLVCHSSKRPPEGIFDPVKIVENWKGPERFDQDFLAWARNTVQEPDFLENNFLSSDARVPVTILKTNSSRALQNNATVGHVWQDFSSVEYKATPSVGTIRVFNPFDEKHPQIEFEMPSGGPGFYRVPSLKGIWARAPFLHNNSLGNYYADPSVAGRMKGFDDAIRKMFWKETRDGAKSIARTSKRSYLRISRFFIPVAIEGILGAHTSLFVLENPWFLPLLFFGIAFIGFRWGKRVERKRPKIALRISTGLALLLALLLIPLNFFAAGKLGDIEIGPFPAGTPINMLTNLDPHAPKSDVLPVMLRMTSVLGRIESEGLSDEEGLTLLEETVGADLLRLSKAPDWVQDRGHYFAESLSDEDKFALIAFLKRF